MIFALMLVTLEARSLAAIVARLAMDDKSTKVG